tara:strand:+ start:683 stop:886 length:204 start_codon:yes stop_codon:yes gene_type:complete
MAPSNPLIMHRIALREKRRGSATTGDGVWGMNQRTTSFADPSADTNVASPEQRNLGHGIQPRPVDTV